MALKLALFDTVLGRFKTSALIEGNVARRAGTTDLDDEDTSKAITFSSPLPDTNYAIALTMENVTDGTPIYNFQMIVTAKATTGFTASWPVGVDSANYKLSWTATPNT